MRASRATIAFAIDGEPGVALEPCDISFARMLLARGDEVVLIGSQGDETVSAEMLAGWAGTINYEILSRLGAHLPRVLVD